MKYAIDKDWTVADLNLAAAKIRQASITSDELQAEELAELVVTLDPITTGFMEDLQLVI